MTSGRILLTGASGFLGRHVRARAADLSVPLVPSSGDLRDPAVARREVGLVRPSAVIHLAAAHRSRSAPWDLLLDEIRMAAGVLSAVSEVEPGATVLIPGSASQYGLAAERPLTETDPLLPVTAYGAMKCALEFAATAPAYAGQAKVIWARTFNMVGPGQSPDAPVPAWARQIAELERSGGGVLRTGELDVVRDFLDVRDAADILLELALSDFSGVVNVGSGVSVSLRDLVDDLITLADVPIVVEPQSALIRPHDPRYVVADVTRLRAVTATSPRFELHQSLEEVLAEYRAASARSEVA